MTIHIIRHGETEYNRLGIVQGSGVDTELNATGYEQARAFFKHYRDIPFDLVVTSELRRTHQTVHPFLDAGLPWVRTPDINEISWGVHEGQPNTPERLMEYKTTIQAWESGDLHAAIPGGESAWQLGQRIENFINWMHTRPASQVLVCTHGRTMRALITLLKGLSLDKMELIRHQNTGCFIVHHRDDRFVVEVENSTDHLESLLFS